MAYDFSKGSKTIRKIGFLEGASGSKIRSVSPFPLESSKGFVAKYFDSTKQSLSATRLLDQSPLNSGTRRTGEEGRCYLYDGVDDYSVMDSEITLSGDFSICWRINAITYGIAWNFLRRDALNRIIFYANGSELILYSNSTTSTFTISPALTAGVWYQMSLVRSSGIYTLYVDGVAQDDTEANTDDFILKNISAVSSSLSGSLFDLRIYDKALTQNEINFVKSFGQTGTDPILPVNWWKCDEQSGTIGYDSVGGNHLTHTNITAGTFHATQDIWSFQNQVGFNKRMYFDGTDYIAVSGMSASASYFGTCTISAKIFIFDPSSTQVIFCLGQSAYRLYINSSGNFGLNDSTDTGVPASKGYHTVSIDFNSSGNAISFKLNGAEVWTGSAYTVAATNVFYIGARDNSGVGLFFKGLIWDFSLTGSSVKNFSFNGYGNTDADWEDQIGSNNGTVNGSPSNILLPRAEDDTANDVFGNPLTNTGRRPNDAALHSSNCLTLNGTNQGVKVADNTDLDIIDNLTVTCWAKNDDVTLLGVEAIFGKWDSGVGQREWAMFVNTDEKLDIRIGSSGGAVANIRVADAAIDPSVLHHYAFTFESGTMTLYIDGVEVSSSTTSGTIPSSLVSGTSKLAIGAALSNDTIVNSWDGQIFDARIYAGDSTVLTAAQIQSIYEDGPNNVQFASQSLRAHYKLAEGGGTQCLDASGNENHGTIENAATNWSVTQDLVHSNLSDGFVYAYQPAKQVFTGAQAANITGISFKFRSTDTNLIIFSDDTPSSYLIYCATGSTSTAWRNGIAGMTLAIDGSTEWGTTLGDLYNALCDGGIHEVVLTNLSFASSWVTDGIFINRYAGNQAWDSSTYLWDIVATGTGDLTPADPDVRLPSVTSSLGPYSIPLTDLPSDPYRNRAETLIDFDPDSTPEMGAVQLNPNVYQTAQQVFTAAQAANITGISFKFRSTDNALIIFNDGSFSPYLLSASSSDGTPTIYTDSGTPVIAIDGEVYAGANRIALYNAICDGEAHEIVISGISFSSGWLTGGVYINSYAGWEWDSSTYLWDLQATGTGDLTPIKSIHSDPYTPPSSLAYGDNIDDNGGFMKRVDFDSNNWGGIFNGSSYATIGKIGKLSITTEPFEIEALIRLTDTGANYIFSKYTTTGNQRSYSFYVSNGDLFFTTSSDGTAVSTLIGSVSVNDGLWHKVKAVRETASSTTVRIYIDGVEDSGTAGSVNSSFHNGTAPAVIGGYNSDATPAGQFNGDIRDVKVTVSGILVGHWELSKDVKDSTSNSFDAVNTGITFYQPKKESSYVIDKSFRLEKSKQYIEKYTKSKLYENY